VELPIADSLALFYERLIRFIGYGNFEEYKVMVGNRSIIADARFAAANARINSIIKKRDTFQPFAPSVLEEELHTYFELPSRVRTLPFMVSAARVKPAFRDKLAANQPCRRHGAGPDGVTQAQSALLVAGPRRRAAHRLSHRAEHVLQQPGRTRREFGGGRACLPRQHELDYLVVEDLLISKRADMADRLWDFHLHLRLGYELWHRPGKNPTHEIRRTGSWESRRISPELYKLLSGPEGSTIAQRADADSLASHRAALTSELLRLWNARVLGLAPGGRLSGCRFKRSP
jgi:carbamoyltransferase